MAAQVTLPPGYRLQWAGQYRYLERAKARLAVVVPVTLAIIFLLLLFNSGSAVQALIVMLAVPYLSVTLKPGERRTYHSPKGHTAAWVAVREADIRGGEPCRA